MEKVEQMNYKENISKEIKSKKLCEDHLVSLHRIFIRILITHKRNKFFFLRISHGLTLGGLIFGEIFVSVKNG